ncbi:MAG TPA: hypothetical protein VHZ55_32200 [Bryobacteraceae bacterium]|nr:hypothetical protein [Bryobacteraceae bacterium]
MVRTSEVFELPDKTGSYGETGMVGDESYFFGGLDAQAGTNSVAGAGG